VTEKETYCDCLMTLEQVIVIVRDLIASKINSFTASPATAAAGESTTLSWDSKDADRCDIGVGATNISGKQPASGSYVVYPAVTTTYKLSCLNEALGYSSDNASTVVTVSGVSGTAPVANISANGTAGEGEEKSPPATTTVNLGENVRISWTSINASECALTSSLLV
jgi:hypothetical protein